MGQKRREGGDKHSDEYREKRRKNNDAVKKSRDKTKKKAVEASRRVQQLMVDNERLKTTIDDMTRELQYLKDMLFMPSNDVILTPELEADIQRILNQEDPSGAERVSEVVEQVRRLNPNPPLHHYHPH